MVINTWAKEKKKNAVSLKCGINFKDDDMTPILDLKKYKIGPTTQIFCSAHSN